jgi:hypothetical protein
MGRQIHPVTVAGDLLGDLSIYGFLRGHLQDQIRATFIAANAAVGGQRFFKGFTGSRGLIE